MTAHMTAARVEAIMGALLIGSGTRAVGGEGDDEGDDPSGEGMTEGVTEGC